MENNKTDKKTNDWQVGRIFWGLLLVLIGAMLIADNFGWLNANWGDLWRLWPMLIIAAGLSILSIRSLIWKILSVILAAGALLAVAFVALGSYPAVHTFENRNINIDKDGIHITVNKD